MCKPACLRVMCMCVCMCLCAMQAPVYYVCIMLDETHSTLDIEKSRPLQGILFSVIVILCKYTSKAQFSTEN